MFNVDFVSIGGFSSELKNKKKIILSTTAIHRFLLSEELPDTTAYVQWTLPL